MPDTPPVLPTPPPTAEDLCQWAKDGLRAAMDGMVGPSSGVKSYHIGTRGLERVKAGDQLDIIAWWQKQVEYYCGIPAPPADVMGLDSACRVIPRDV